MTIHLQLLGNRHCVVLYDTIWGITHTHTHSLCLRNQPEKTMWRLQRYLLSHHNSLPSSPSPAPGGTHRLCGCGKEARHVWTRSFSRLLSLALIFWESHRVSTIGISRAPGQTKNRLSPLGAGLPSFLDMPLMGVAGEAGR